MIALGIIILIIVLLLLLPVGADAAYGEGGFSLKLKVGPFRIGIIPAKPKDGEKKEKKPGKEKKTKKSASAEKSGHKAGEKPKQKLTFDDIMGIVRLGLQALGRFRRSISVDLLKLHITVGGDDPYDSVISYGRINTALGAALPLLHRCFKIRREDYDSRLDFESEKLKFDLRAVLSVRIGEILLIVICAGVGFLKWMLRRKRRAKAEAKAAAAKEKITENSSAEKGN